MNSVRYIVRFLIIQPNFGLGIRVGSFASGAAEQTIDLKTLIWK
jgi:hypothetical protein